MTTNIRSYNTYMTLIEYFECSLKQFGPEFSLDGFIIKSLNYRATRFITGLPVYKWHSLAKLVPGDHVIELDGPTLDALDIRDKVIGVVKDICDAYVAYCKKNKIARKEPFIRIFEGKIVERWC